jgi:23S rRNA (adenine2503-C2)-methyltransferase
MIEQKKRLAGMTLEELKAVASEACLPAYAAKQMADWLYKKKVTSIGAMTNISAAKRLWLEERYEVGMMPPAKSVTSADGTVKYAFRHHASGGLIESVFIPSDERATLCVSSQLGCKMSCVFCMTGRNGFTANLTSADIMNQILSIPETDKLTNIVFMGMGEPFDNTDEVMKTLEILTSDYGFAWSPKRITVSTIGAKGLRRFLDESTCNIAVSLHATNAHERFPLVPAEKAFPMHETLDLLRLYDFSHQRRLSFEYTMFRGVNDSPQQAIALAGLLKDIDCRVNLIRYHAIPDTPLEPSDNIRMERFRDTLNSRGIISTIRISRGEDIFAACGMLSSAKK